MNFIFLIFLSTVVFSQYRCCLRHSTGIDTETIWSYEYQSKETKESLVNSTKTQSDYRERQAWFYFQTINTYTQPFIINLPRASEPQSLCYPAHPDPVSIRTDSVNKAWSWLCQLCFHAYPDSIVAFFYFFIFANVCEGNVILLMKTRFHYQSVYFF